MNVRAHDLTVTLRAILGTLPGAVAIGIHASRAWTMVLITTSSDEAVIALGEALGLGGVEVRIAVDRWWRRAMWDGEQDPVRVVVVGPHHLGSPPRDDAGEASS